MIKRLISTSAIRRKKWRESMITHFSGIKMVVYSSYLYCSWSLGNSGATKYLTFLRLKFTVSGSFIILIVTSDIQYLSLTRRADCELTVIEVGFSLYAELTTLRISQFCVSMFSSFTTCGLNSEMWYVQRLSDSRSSSPIRVPLLLFPLHSRSKVIVFGVDIYICAYVDKSKSERHLHVGRNLHQ